ncbi:MAG: hypothetical protein KGH72_02300 [Candidatus Micrarchaeota archaeon]|nr:hypothetical protein [Candidatus Micrarchaeota archaeon]
MSKTKLTLSVDKEVIKDAKSQAVLTDSSISDLVEDFLRSVGRSWVDELRAKLKIQEKFVSYEDVIKRRPKGSSSERLIRSMRDDRENRLFGQ